MFETYNISLRPDTVEDFMVNVQELYDQLWDKDFKVPEKTIEEYWELAVERAKERMPELTLPSFPKAQKANYDICAIVVALMWFAPCVQCEYFKEELGITVEFDE